MARFLFFFLFFFFFFFFLFFLLLFFFYRAPAANAPGCSTACRLIVLSCALEVSTCTARRPHVYNDGKLSARTYR
jgi:hypothetical protein